MNGDYPHLTSDMYAAPRQIRDLEKRLTELEKKVEQLLKLSGVKK